MISENGTMLKCGLSVDSPEVVSVDLKKAGAFHAVQVRQDGKIVAVACGSGLVQLYRGKDLKYLGSLRYHDDAVRSLAFTTSPTDNTLFCGGYDGRISMWKIY